MHTKQILNGLVDQGEFSLNRAKEHAARCIDGLKEFGFTVPLELREIHTLTPSPGREWLAKKCAFLLKEAADNVRQQEIDKYVQ